MCNSRPADAWAFVNEGPVMVVDPARVWYRRVQLPDAAEILPTHLLNAKPVDRLVSMMQQQ